MILKQFYGRRLHDEGKMGVLNRSLGCGSQDENKVKTRRPEELLFE